MIIIEHRLEDAMHMGADRIILMENGRIISDSAPEELFLSDRLIKAGIREPLYLTSVEKHTRNGSLIKTIPHGKPGSKMTLTKPSKLLILMRTFLTLSVPKDTRLKAKPLMKNL